MDPLEVIAGTARPLLRRVDRVLAGVGAPPEHRVWAELRRVRLLPGDAVDVVAGLRTVELRDAVPELRAAARSYADVAGSLPGAGGWTGLAADTFDRTVRRTAGQLSGGAESLDERLEATADLAAALVDWINQTRGALAGTLADVLASAEAITLSPDWSADDQAATGPAADAQIRAAADVAAAVLHSVADSYELAADLLHASTDLARSANDDGAVSD